MLSLNVLSLLLPLLTASLLSSSTALVARVRTPSISLAAVSDSLLPYSALYSLFNCMLNGYLPSFCPPSGNCSSLPFIFTLVAPIIFATSALLLALIALLLSLNLVMVSCSASFIAGSTSLAFSSTSALSSSASATSDLRLLISFCNSLIFSSMVFNSSLNAVNLLS